jgi:hypothetical protein
MAFTDSLQSAASSLAGAGGSVSPTPTAAPALPEMTNAALGDALPEGALGPDGLSKLPGVKLTPENAQQIAGFALRVPGMMGGIVESLAGAMGSGMQQAGLPNPLSGLFQGFGNKFNLLGGSGGDNSSLAGFGGTVFNQDNEV